jgi:hypothetical protein
MLTDLSSSFDLVAGGWIKQMARKMMRGSLPGGEDIDPRARAGEKEVWIYKLHN